LGVFTKCTTSSGSLVISIYDFCLKGKLTSKVVYTINVQKNQ